MDQHEHANQLALHATQYAAYEQVKNETFGVIEAIRDIQEAAWASDPMVMKTHKQLLHLPYALEPLIPREYNGYAVRNATHGFNVHLMDEDHLNIMMVENVPANGIVDAFKVLAARYALFGFTFNGTARAYTPADPEGNATTDDETIFMALTEYTKGDSHEALRTALAQVNA